MTMEKVFILTQSQLEERDRQQINLVLGRIDVGTYNVNFSPPSPDLPKEIVFPSDEEIEELVGDITHFGKEYKEGAKWYRDSILKQIK